MVASLGIERWSQRAGELARVMRQHTVVVSRWVRQLREDDNEYSGAVEALDNALSREAIAHLRDPVRPTRKGQGKGGEKG